MFWTKFVELCEGQGLKPRKIAAEFDVAPATVTRWKHGSVPRADTLEKIAERLGVTPDFMLSEEEYMKTPPKSAVHSRRSLLSLRGGQDFTAVLISPISSSW